VVQPGVVRSPSTPDSARQPGRRQALAAAALAGTLAGLLLWLGPPGQDLAAHTYQRDVFLDHGFALWNNFWYAGRYSFVTYSLLYYPLAAPLGISILAVASIAGATFAFALVAGHEWGESARLPTFAFAVVWASTVLSGAFPFVLGVALALFALAVLQRRRNWLFALLAALTPLASPPAFVLLGVVLVAAVWVRRTHWRANGLPAAAIAAIVVVELLLHRLFPDSWRFPFPPLQFAVVFIFCVCGVVLTSGVTRARILHAMFVVYMIAAAVAFIVPSGIGENIARVRLAAVPITLLTVALRKWRPLAVSWVVLVLACTWNLATPVANLLSSRNDPTSDAEFWEPVTRFLGSRSGQTYRVEVVDTRGHWGAFYLPRAGFPVARGWFRQDDFPVNSVLYEQFDRRAYLAWLHRLGVRYVVLPNGPRDYSAKREANLLRSGRSGLRVVRRGAGFAIYEVPAPRPLVTGPHDAALVSLTETNALLRVEGPGVYRVAIRSSPYLHASRGCLGASADGMLRLRVRRAGPVEIRFAITRGDVLETLSGEHAACAR
jgi:MFS family permease